MRGRVEFIGDKPQYAAVMRGPILLARDEALKGLGMGSIVNLSGKIGYVDLVSVPHTSENVWLQFSLKFSPESYKEQGDAPVTVDLCDYASAGNGKEATYFKAWFPQLIDPKKDH